MTRTQVLNELKAYRRRWYRARETVKRIHVIDDPDATEEWAKTKYFLITDQWIRRLLPIDTVENDFGYVWHEREIGPYEGLREYFENESLDDYDDAAGMDMDTINQAGKAIEYITVIGFGLPQQPPANPQPLKPKRKEARRRIRELRGET